MGYRHYFYKVNKADVEKVKDMDLKEILAYLKETGVNIDEESALAVSMMVEQAEKSHQMAKNFKANLKSEAYREFAERLKAKDEINNLGDGYVTIKDVTETYKELVGEDDA